MSEAIRLIRARYLQDAPGVKVEEFDRQLPGMYHSLGADEVRELARAALDDAEPRASDLAEPILLGLACFRPGSLREFHAILVDRGIFSPGVLYHGAAPEVAARIMGMLPGDVSRPRNGTHDMLVALAWIGGATVQEAFLAWRKDRPDWSARLRNPPDRYPEEAGWELTPSGGRRDLFVPGCHPLVEPGTEPTDEGVAGVVSDYDEACGWCGRRMTVLLYLDLASPKIAYLGLRGRRLRFATCEACDYDGTILTRIDLDGRSSWHESNGPPPPGRRGRRW